MMMVSCDRVVRALVMLRANFSVFESDFPISSSKSYSMDRIQPTLKHNDANQASAVCVLDGSSSYVQSLVLPTSKSYTSAMTNRDVRREPVLNTGSSAQQCLL